MCEWTDCHDNPMFRTGSAYLPSSIVLAFVAVEITVALVAIGLGMPQHICLVLLAAVECSRRMDVNVHMAIISLVAEFKIQLADSLYKKVKMFTPIFYKNFLPSNHYL